MVSMASETRKDTAIFECDAPASPARVKALAEMVEASLTAILGRPPREDEFTLVVSNRDMKGHLRAYTEEAAKAGRAIERLLRDPMSARKVPRDRVAPVLHALREGMQPLKTVRLRVRDARRKHETVVDEVLLGVLKGIENETKSEVPKTRSLHGTSEETTPLLGVVRHVEGPMLFARLRIEGAVEEVPLALEVVDAALEAVRLGGEARVNLEATWDLVGDELRFSAGKSVITRVEHLGQAMSGKELVEAMRELITPDEADRANRLAYEERGIDWRSLP